MIYCELELELDQFQIDTISAPNAEHSVLVAAPTDAGKTIIADYIVDPFSVWQACSTFVGLRSSLIVV